MDARFQRDPNQEELIMRSKLMAAVFVAVMAVPVSGAYAQEALDPALQQQLTAALTGTPEQVADQLDQLLDDNPAMAEAIIAQARAQLPANSPLLNVVNSVASAAGTNNADLPGGKYENAFDPPSLNDTANAFANATLQRNAQTPGGAFMLFGPNNEGFALDLSNQANFELFAPLGAVGASITQFQRLIGNQFFAQMDFTVCTAGLSAVAGPYGAVSFVVSRAC